MNNMLQKIREERIAKVIALRKAGFEPYPSVVKRTKQNAEIVKDFEKLVGQEVSVVGRVKAWRDIGKLIFAQIEDYSGALQLFIRRADLNILPLDTENSAPATENPNPVTVDLSFFDIGDFVEATGIVMKTKTGEISVETKSLRVIAKSIRPLPEKWAGIKDEDKLFRQRYLDFLMNKPSREKIVSRTKVARYMREFFWGRDFLEIENPSLEVSAGGAEARPFITHINAYDINLYLRICAGELWQKMSTVGGFERVFEIARAYRNEGADAEHNPEFTMLEFYWAYSNFNQMLELLEEFFSGVAKYVTGDMKVSYHGKTLDFTPPYKRASYNDLLIQYAGVDLNKFDKLEDLKAEADKLKVEYEPNSSWSTLIDQIFKQKVRPNLFEPVFVIDYPFVITPLAKSVEGKPKFVQMTQLVIDSMEMCRAYGELNDPIDQNDRFNSQKAAKDAGDEVTYEADDDYVEAMEYGMPPMTGCGIGIDRLTKVLTDSYSLREIIAYPIMKPEKKAAKSKVSK